MKFLLIPLLITIFALSCNKKSPEIDNSVQIAKLETKIELLENKFADQIESLSSQIDSLENIVNANSQLKPTLPNELNLKSLSIVDDYGRTLAYLGPQKQSDGIILGFYQKSKNPSILIKSSSDFTGIRVTDQTRNLTSWIVGGDYRMGSSRHYPLLRFGKDDDFGGGGIWINYLGGNQSIFMHDGFISTYNKRNIQTTYMGTSSSQDGSILMFNAEGKPGWGESGTADEGEE